MCSILGMDDQVFARGLKTYEPLPHRLQYIGEREGVKYYDDSISTICDTTIQALKTLKDTDTVLIGGMDRGMTTGELIEYLSDCQVPHIILMEATGKRIYQEIHKYYPEFKNRARLILAEHLGRRCQAGASDNETRHKLRAVAGRGQLWHLQEF